MMWRIAPPNEYTSKEIRKVYREKYNIDVGLYSYGCFDERRIYPGTTIGRYCSFSNSSRVINRNHSMESLSFSPYLYDRRLGRVDAVYVPIKNCVIEDDVWVGHNAIILPSATSIGRGSAIGAGAVVTRNVPPYSVVVGNPGRIIKRRFDVETIEYLEALKWWEWDAEVLTKFATKNPSFVSNASHFPNRIGRHGQKYV
jgi:acetyltransferase-like isoleucine patch superfamily enzyme